MLVVLETSPEVVAFPMAVGNASHINLTKIPAVGKNHLCALNFFDKFKLFSTETAFFQQLC